MKILFLDVDGVLNNDDWMWDMFKAYKVNAYKHNILNEAALCQLRRIINETDAKIVVSSSWRLVKTDYDDLKRWLKMFGMEVYSETPYKGGIREDDIEAWLEEHDDVEQYVILDDEDDMGQLYGHLVQTNFFEGLTKEDADQCIELLKGEETDEDY